MQFALSNISFGRKTVGLMGYIELRAVVWNVVNGSGSTSSIEMHWGSSRTGQIVFQWTLSTVF